MINKLIANIKKTGAPIVVGLDPMLNYIPLIQLEDNSVAKDLLNVAGRDDLYSEADPGSCI